MPNLSWYPDGITRLEAYRRLLARDTARAMSRSRAWTIARLRAAWAAWRAFWRRGSGDPDLAAVSVAQYAITRAAVTVCASGSRRVVAHGVLVGQFYDGAFWADAPLDLAVEMTATLPERIHVTWMGVRTTCVNPQAGTWVRAGERLTLHWQGPVFRCWANV